MHYTDLIQRAWKITWCYKVLWIFGILLALAGASGGGGSGRGGGGSAVPPVPGLQHVNPGQIFAFSAICCCLLIILVVALTILRYVARTALYRGVDQIEATGTGPTWREGFRLGWSKRAFRLWLLDLIVFIPFALVALVLLGLGATPLLLLIIDNPVARGIGIVGTIGLELLIVALLFIAILVLLALGQFWAREIAIADRNLGEAIIDGIPARARPAEGCRRDVAADGLDRPGLRACHAADRVRIIMLALAVGGGLGFALYRLTDSALWALFSGYPRSC